MPAKRLSPQGLIVFHAFLLTALVGLCYFSVLRGPFLWDDLHLVVGNPTIKHLVRLPEVFTQDIGYAAGLPYGFWRPVAMALYALEYAAVGLNPCLYHATNIVLHICVAMLFYGLARFLLKDALIAFVAGAFFAIHPVHTEAVSYISGRADILAALFQLICFLMVVRHSPRRKYLRILLVFLSFGLALMSKESSIVLPFLLWAYFFSFKKKIELLDLCWVSGLAFVYGVIRLIFWPGVVITTNLWERLPGFFAALLKYLGLLIWPVDLHMEYGQVLFDWTHPQVLGGILFFAGMLFFLWRWRKEGGVLYTPRPESRTLQGADEFWPLGHPDFRAQGTPGFSQGGLHFAVLWFLVALLPHANLFPINATMAEHWLYLPSLGFFLILAQGLCWARRNPRLKYYTIGGIGLLAALASLGTIQQNSYWQDPALFYQRMLVYAPESPRLHNNLGMVYSQQRQFGLAIASFEKAVALDPKHASAYNNLGQVYGDLGQKDIALNYFQKSLAAKPDNAEACSYLCKLYKEQGRINEALTACQRAIAINPQYAQAYNNLGAIYHEEGQQVEAIKLFKQALFLDPDNALACNNLGVSLLGQGDREAAFHLLTKTLSLNPDYAEAYNNLGIYYALSDEHEKAVAFFHKALELLPTYAGARENLSLSQQHLRSGKP
ncbi:MAG: tetratricopeptide repeat protein [Candidatus Omnitrophota bacterium]